METLFFRMFRYFEKMSHWNLSLLEIKINRAPPFSIHTCRAVDIETMKRLHDKVNIFPQTSWQRRLVKVVLIKWFFATFGRLPIVWSAGELDSPDRQGGFFHQGGAAGVQTKCSFFFISKNFEIGQKILFYKFSSDLQPTGKREDLIPQLHHVPQPGWGNKSCSAYLETKS